MATKSFTMGSATIGPQSWRSSTLKDIELSRSAIRRSDQTCVKGRMHDPLPNLRPTRVELSNEEARKHFRETRCVVNQLRENLMETNEEIKSLSRTRDELVNGLESVRKALQLNEENQKVRARRPHREQTRDGVDDLFHAERMHLLNLKRMLETQLKLVKEQLQVLDKARKRLSDVTQERSRVLDLICHAIPATSASARPASRRTRCTVPSTNGWPSSINCFSPMLDIDPLGAYTPEVDSALRDAAVARQRSASLRNDAKNTLNNVNEMLKTALKSVNDGLTQKLAETVSLKQELQSAAGENHTALNRAQRWYDATETAWGYCNGPVSSADLLSHEKLDRPIMKVLQRHPGNNMPEAQEMVKGSRGLLQSMRSTGYNIGMLRVAQLQLKDDIRSKNAAIDVDSSIVRTRRRKADGRWVMGAAY